jgi:hypothetical protein
VGGNEFFDIPVYRIAEAVYEAVFSSDLEKCEALKINEELYNRYPDLKVQFLEHKRKTYGGMWRYNEIIGYLRLYILGTQIRAWYFENDVKKHCKSRRKQFIYRTHKLASEMDLLWPWRNEEIFKVMMSYLNSCKKQLPNRFVDTRDFELVGKHLDWKGLLEYFQAKLELAQ